jgi:hypothetical protein
MYGTYSELLLAFWASIGFKPGESELRGFAAF